LKTSHLLHGKNLYLQQNLDATIEGALVLSGLDISGLQGVTLKVYLYAVKKNGAIGPREVMRGANLSSPSVAYRHLQKLETMGLLTKDERNNYIVKEKVSIRGYVWVGRTLIPNPLLYSVVFLGILITQLVVLAIHFSVETDEFKTFFLLLTLITAAALILFAIEGLRMLTKTRIHQQTKQTI
jgi:predicted transcriptional regulator